MRQAGASGGIRHDAACNLATRLRHQFGVGSHTDSQHQNVKINRLSAFQRNLMFIKRRSAVRQHKPQPFLFQIGLYPFGGRFVQHTGQNAVRHIHHRDLLDPFVNTFGAFQSDQTCPHDQHAGFRGDRLTQSGGIIQRHKGKHLINGVQSLHGRYKRP